MICSTQERQLYLSTYKNVHIYNSVSKVIRHIIWRYSRYTLFDKCLLVGLLPQPDMDRHFFNYSFVNSIHMNVYVFILKQRTQAPTSLLSLLVGTTVGGSVVVLCALSAIVYWKRRQTCAGI